VQAGHREAGARAALKNGNDPGRQSTMPETDDKTDHEVPVETIEASCPRCGHFASYAKAAALTCKSCQKGFWRPLEVPKHEPTTSPWPAESDTLPREGEEQRRRRLKSMLATVAAWLFVPMALLFIWLIARIVTASEKRQFDAMTPAGQHLARAREALAEGAFEEGLREIHAIPSSGPEAVSAKEVEDRLNAALQSARRAAEARAEQERVETLKNDQIHTVEVQLRELGYDLRISGSGKPDEVTISSNDFSDTDHRVRFLAYIRSQRGPGHKLCLLGVKQARLGQGFLQSGDSYSLECWK